MDPQNWRHYRVDCINAIVDQAKFIKNAIQSDNYPGEKVIERYIDELAEMVDVLKSFTKE